MARATGRWMAVAILAVGLLAPTRAGVAGAEPSAAGAPPPSPDGRGPERRPPPLDDLLERNADRLGLDEKTRAAIRTLTDAAREERKGLEDALRGLHEEMRKLLDQETPDLETALHQADRVGAAETELRKLRLRTMLRIRALLTPAQRQELVRLHDEEHRDRGRGGPPGPPPPPRDAP